VVKAFKAKDPVESAQTRFIGIPLTKDGATMANTTISGDRDNITTRKSTCIPMFLFQHCPGDDKRGIEVA
jgi:hypothetical protein